MKKIATLVLFAILLLSMTTVLTATTKAATEEEIEQAIEKGVAWLATKQNLDGSWGTENQPAKTGFAVLKFETHAIRQCMDPLDPSYEYYAQVRDGLDYIFLTASTTSIGMQPAGNPDTDGDGIGVHWSDLTYYTGIAMMAIAASTHPEMTVDVVGSAVDDWTYKEVVQDAVDYFAWGQTDIGGTYRGGWSYESMDNAEYHSDNSNTGYAVLGLAYAEADTIDRKTGFGCTIPDFVRSELNFWIDYIQNDVGVGDPTHDGGSGYTDPDYWVNVLKTGNLCFEMAFYGDDTTVQRVIDAVDYIDRHWNDPDYIGWKGPGPGGDPTWPACYQAMYCIMKGLEILNVEYISPLNDPSGIDWFDDLANVLIAQQNIDGSWPNAPFFGAADGTPYSPPGGWAWDTDQIISTEWALLTLQKAVVEIEIPVDVDIKPGSWPNPINIASKGVFAVAICGTEDFDVTTIDPTTVKIYAEDIEEGVSPIRWHYEDVATPYTGEPGGGHACGGDGYMDLVFHFDTQAVVTTVTLTGHVGETVPLIIRGNLYETANGRPIVGQDYVRIQAPRR